MNAIIQLGFDPQDNRMWWTDMHLWDTRDETPDTVKRPTESVALKRMYRQSRLLQKRGVFINLSPLHLQALRLEHQALSTPPYPDKVYLWISQRMRGVKPLQVKALLDECSLVTLLRDVLEMHPLDIEWGVEPAQKDKRAA